MDFNKLIIIMASAKQQNSTHTHTKTVKTRLLVENIDLVFESWTHWVLHKIIRWEY